MMHQTLDIHSLGAYPSNVLSNFYQHRFVFDDAFCDSMEGLLQSLRYANEQEQLHVCSTHGRTAKSFGKKRIINDTLYWKGVSFNRHSESYQNLLEHAYDCLFLQSKSFRDALRDSMNSELIHTIGKDNRFDTILTNEEFIGNLNRLRKLIS